MIEKKTLRALIFDAVRVEAETSFDTIVGSVRQAAIRRNAFPTQEECQRRQVKWWQQYREQQLPVIDQLSIYELVWDLVIERVLTPCTNASNPDWRSLRLTEFGRAVLDGTVPPYYDDEEYLATLRSFAPSLDPVVEQYALEGAGAYRRQLFFAAAVMFGAAAEKAVLGLLESIASYEPDARRKKRIVALLERPRLPEIFDAVQETVKRLGTTKVFPYAVHQGSIQHLLSLFDMIRVQRNDAVHPAAAQVSREKVLLTMQSLPSALACAGRLAQWFSRGGP